MEVIKLYETNGKRTYLVSPKDKVSKDELIEYARKNFRVRADQIIISNAEKDSDNEDTYFVELNKGNYWCATRSSKIKSN